MLLKQEEKKGETFSNSTERKKQFLKMQTPFKKQTLPKQIVLNSYLSTFPISSHHYLVFRTISNYI